MDHMGKENRHFMLLAHAKCTLFFTSRAAFVCKKKDVRFPRVST